MVIDRYRMFVIKQRIAELKRAIAREETPQRLAELELLEEELREFQVGYK